MRIERAHMLKNMADVDVAPREAEAEEEAEEEEEEEEESSIGGSYFNDICYIH
jgi:hypothetical protein